MADQKPPPGGVSDYPFITDDSQLKGAVPLKCRQRLAAEGKAYPRSSCEVCGPYAPNWMSCDAALAAAPKAEPVSDPYKLVTVADLIAWVEGQPHSTSWIATALDISAIVEKMVAQPLSNPQQLPEAPKVEQEPVAWRYRMSFQSDGCWYYAIEAPEPHECGDHKVMAAEPLYTRPAPASDELLDLVVRVQRFLEPMRFDRKSDNNMAAELDIAMRAALAKHKGPQS
jgi:hypothetical protein